MERKETLKKGADNMATERVNRINQAIKETHALLNKEYAYETDLQDVKLINEYQNHITKLINMKSAYKRIN